jgi:hypothetical protein
LASVIVVAAVAGTGLYLLNLGGEEPSPTGEIISLTHSYSPSEKMTYNQTMTTDILGRKTTQTATTTMEVLSVQGDTYTIKTTTNTGYGSSSSTISMDKTGHITYLDGLNGSVQRELSPLSSLPLSGSSFNKSQARVGESWQISLDAKTNTYSIEGTMNCKVSEVKALTVPAGTYNVFKLEMSISNYSMSMNSTGANIDVVMDADGYYYLEKDTGLPVQMKLQAKVSGSTIGQSANVSTEMEMQLTKHTR